MRNGLTGDLHFGAIPAAMPMAPLVTSAFCRSYPLVTLKVLSLSSIEIQRGLDAAELKAGLTYLDNEPLRNVQAHPMHGEQYMLLTPTGGQFDGMRAASWREAATLPLCLLTSVRRNRTRFTVRFRFVHVAIPNRTGFQGEFFTCSYTWPACGSSPARSIAPISRHASAVESISLRQGRYAHESHDSNLPFHRR